MSLSKRVPPSLKSQQHMWAISFDFEKRAPLTCYYIRLFVLQESMKIDKSTPEAKKFIISVMDNLEIVKKDLQDVTEPAGLRDIMTQACKLLAAAEKMDHAQSYSKNIVKCYFSAALLFESLNVFENYDNSQVDKARFAKWRSTYIHQCLSKGEQPSPPEKDDGDDELESELEKELAELDGLNGNLGGDLSVQRPTQQNLSPQLPSVRAPQRPVEPKPQNFNPPQQNFNQPQQHFNPPQQNFSQPQQSSYPKLDKTQIERFKKLLKFSTSALETYSDSPGAMEQLEKAMNLLRTGQE